MIVQDDIHGIAGRPTEGALSVALKVLGNGQAVQARFAVVEDGLMVTYATAKKGWIVGAATAVLRGVEMSRLIRSPPRLRN